MGKLSMMAAFVALVEEGSYTLAAEKIGGSKSVVSNRIQKLEEAVGIRLVNRSTRSVSVTDNGRVFYRRCLDILDRIAGLESDLTEDGESISGDLRIAAPQTFGLRYVVPVCSEFAKAHPAVRLDIELDDRHVDLVEKHIDVGVRIGFLEDSNLAARTIGYTRFVMVASPEYLAGRAEIRSPDDLLALDCILDTNKRKRHCWEAVSGKAPMKAPPEPRISMNSANAVRVAALAGLGVTRTFGYLVREDIEAGRLVELLPEFASIDIPVQIVFPHRTLMPAKSRAFIDYVAEGLGAALQADRPADDALAA